jgi:hypothetical protein
MVTKTGDMLKVKEKVVAARHMPGIPEGTKGKVVMVAGFEWIRYWVRFENGQVRGSIDRSKLARVKDWADIQARRARGEEDTDAVAGPAAAVADDGDAAASSTESVTYAGVAIPGNLIERTKKRRELLGK